MFPNIALRPSDQGVWFNSSVAVCGRLQAACTWAAGFASREVAFGSLHEQGTWKRPCLCWLQEAPGEPGGWGALLLRRYRLIMVLAAALPLWQQLSGINTVVFYSSEVPRRCPPGCHRAGP